MYNLKVKLNIPKLEQLQRKKELVVFVKKLNALRCTASVFLRVNCVPLNVHVMGVIITNKAKA